MLCASKLASPAKVKSPSRTKFAAHSAFARVTTCSSRSRIPAAPEKLAPRPWFGLSEAKVPSRNFVASELRGSLVVERPSFDGFVICANHDHRCRYQRARRALERGRCPEYTGAFRSGRRLEPGTSRYRRSRIRGAPCLALPQRSLS